MRRTSEIQKLQLQVCVTGLDRALGTATPSEGVRTYKKEMTRVLQRLIALRKEPEPTVSGFHRDGAFIKAGDLS